MYIPFYSRFVGGQSIQAAIKIVSQSNWIPIFDMAKEGNKAIEDVTKDYERIMKDMSFIDSSMKPAFFALKGSTFAFNYDNYPKIYDIARKAHTQNLSIVFDAELSTNTSFEDACIRNLRDDGIDVYKTYQMYRKDAFSRLMKDMSDGHICKFKIVRGAYLHEEVKHNTLLTSKQEVDLMYDKAVNDLINYMKYNGKVHVMVASHNKTSIEYVVNHAVDTDVRSRLYVAQLLGMADNLTVFTHQRGYNTCKYVPYGSISETMPYLIRRLYENTDILKHIK